MSNQQEQLNQDNQILTEQVNHEVTIFAEPIFHIGDFQITNSLLISWFAVLLVLIIGLGLRKKIDIIPGKIQNIFEMVIDKFLEIFDSVTNSREKSLKFFPLIFALFVFILLNNWFGLLPGVGSIGRTVSGHGEKVFVPFFRGGTADLNTTLALAIIGVVASHIIGVVSVGIFNHFNKFINIKAILEMPGRIFKDPAVLVVNPIKVFVGVLEIIGEIAKVASLSFRLFGNIFAGEVLLASISAIFVFGAPIPFMFLEVLVGLIQALIFAILVLVYLTMNTTVEEH